MNEYESSPLCEPALIAQSKPWKVRLSFLFSPNVNLSIFTIFLLAVIGWFGLSAVEKEMKSNLAAQLQNTLSANVEALKLWIEDKKLDAQVLASQPEIREKILSLISLVKNEDPKPGFLKKTQELIWLRKYLGAACKKYGFIGFVLLDTTGFQIGAILDDPVGKRQLIEHSDFFYRSLQGDTVVSRPFIGEVDLPDVDGVWQKDWPTMFASTPIRNDGNEIVAILSFRIRPETAFTRILEINSWANTGETFAFNGEGLMLSDSRFNSQLKKSGLLPDTPESRAILKMQIRDPGGNMMAGHRSALPRSKQPLTLMAASATKGKMGINVDGYNDYRGVPVVGAWTWVPDHHFGVATEMDVEEAFAPLQSMNYWFLIVFGLFTLSTFSAFLFHLRQVQTERDRQSALQKVTENEIRYRTIMDNTNDAVVTINERGIIETFNPAAEFIFGYKSTDIVGQNIKVIMPEPYRSDHDGYLERYLTTGKNNILNLVREVHGVRDNGSVFDLEISVRKMELSGNIRYVGTLKDITDRKQAEKKLQTYADDLVQSNMELQDFAAIASHDLQEPLRKIIIFGDRLETQISNKDPKGQDTLKRMQRSAERMRRFINDLLEFSKVTNKTKILSSVDLNKLIPQVVEDLDLIIKKSQGKVFMGSLPIINGDIFQIRQLFQNLLANAIKYSQTGVPPVIKIKCSSKDDSFAKISIEDNGIGFDEKYVHKIFKPFERLHTRDQYEGTGMGLAICQKIVHQHGGRITVKSKPSLGTTFIISLPARSESAQKQSQELSKHQ